MKVSVCLLTVALASGAVAQIVSPLVDDFNGAGLDGAVWSSGGYGAHYQTVSGGELTIGVGTDNSYHHSYVQSRQSDFDFFNETIQLDWALGAAGIGDDVFQPYTVSYSTFRIGWGLTSNPGDGDFTSSSGIAASALFLGIEMPHDASGYYPTILGQRISAVPTAMHVELDATTANVTLEGAVFTGTNSNTASIAHAKDAANFSSFYLTGVYWQKGTVAADFVNLTDSIAIYSGAISVVPEPAIVSFLLGALSLMVCGRRRRG